MVNGNAPDALHPLRVANALLRYRHVVVAAVVLPLVFVVGLSLITRRTWTSTLAFTPQVPTAGAGLTGLAAQFGFSFGSSAPARSPAFYADFIKSPDVLRALAQTRFALPVGADTVVGSVTDHFMIKGRSEALRLEVGIDRLRRAVEASSVQRTGVVRVTVRTAHPVLSVSIAHRIVELVGDFNLQTRQSQAAAERRFVETRITAVHQELRQSEDRLQTFLQRNRDYRNSPQLLFEFDRLSRDVTMHQQVYTTLTQSLEQAKIEEVRDTPVITVVEEPALAVRPDPRRLVTKAFAALVIGLIGGTLLALVATASQNVRAQQPADYAEFSVLASATVRELFRPWSLISRFALRRKGRPSEAGRD